MPPAGQQRYCKDYPFAHVEQPNAAGIHSFIHFRIYSPLITDPTCSAIPAETICKTRWSRASAINCLASLCLSGNKQKWVPLMIEVKSEGPRERSASRNNSRQNENLRLPPNARNDLRGECHPAPWQLRHPAAAATFKNPKIGFYRSRKCCKLRLFDLNNGTTEVK